MAAVRGVGRTEAPLLRSMHNEEDAFFGHGLESESRERFSDFCSGGSTSIPLHLALFTRDKFILGSVEISGKIRYTVMSDLIK